MKNKHRVGLLFCGGCNCFFDREDVYKRLKEQYGHKCAFSIYHGESEAVFDLVVLINGCQSECLMEGDYPGRLLLINSLNYKEADSLFGEALKAI